MIKKLFIVKLTTSMRYVFLFFLTISRLEGLCQVNPDKWYEGRVFLDSQTSIQGQIKYDFENDLVYVNVDNLLKTFPARKFESFEIKDEESERMRSFYSLLYNRVGDYKVPMLFELVKEGKHVSVLQREFITTESVPQYDLYTHRNYYYSRNIIAFNLFFLFPSGKIRQYRNSKADLIDLLKDKSGEIRKFVNENRLKPERREDLMEIIDYYNSLKK